MPIFCPQHQWVGFQVLSKRKKIAILGAGVSGLALGWFLKKKFQNQIELTILEKTERAGGWIRTEKKEDFLFEAGPRGFRPHARGETTLQLIRELGVEKELISANSQARIRYIFQKGKLTPLNIPFLIRQGVIQAALKECFVGPNKCEDESLWNFVSRRFNKKLASHLMDPLAWGIFGGDSQKLSARSCFPYLWNLDQKGKSIILNWLSSKKKKSGPSLYSFKNGMQTLTDTLAQKLESSLHFSEEIGSLEHIEADITISTLPAYKLISLFNLKNSIDYASLSTLNFGWQTGVLRPKGYGFLIPTQEKAPILGMTWDSQIFPEQSLPGSTRICIMVAGAPENLLTLGINSLKTYLNITEKPDCHWIHTSHQAIPQYTLNHFQRVAELQRHLPSHFFALGNWHGGIGVNDCIFHAKKFVDGLSL